MSDRTLIALAGVFVVVIFVAVAILQNPIAQVLDTIRQTFRLGG
jgi:hypothetical protein